MDTEARGQLGGLEAGEGVRKRLAAESRRWGCGVCGRENGEVMREQEELAREAGREGEGEGGGGKEEVPKELSLGYRDEMGKAEGKEAEAEGAESTSAPAPGAQPAGVAGQSSAPAAAPEPASAPAPVPAQRPPQAPALQAQQPRRPPPVAEEIPAWIDTAIYGVVAAIAILVWIKFLG